MALTLPPAAPSRSDPSTFSAKADAFVAWLTAAVPDFNALSLMTASGTFNIGSVTSPAFTFVGDTNTGIYSPAADQIGFSTGGVRRALLTSSALTVDVQLITFTPDLAAIDTTTTPAGDYSYTTGATGTFPTGVTAANGGVISVSRSSTTKGYMTLQPNGSSEFYIRNLNTTWGTWQRLNFLSYTASQATTSGTAFDFTGIPSWVTRITVVFMGVSLTGTDYVLIQLGDSGGIETTGYTSASSAYASTVATVSNTSGLAVNMLAAGAALIGMVTLIKGAAANEWISSHALQTGSGTNCSGGGSKTLSAALDRIRVTRTGTDTFDAGSLMLLLE